MKFESYVLDFSIGSRCGSGCILVGHLVDDKNLINCWRCSFGGYDLDFVCEWHNTQFENLVHFPGKISKGAGEFAVGI